jgi:hypothetical protein
MFLMINQFYYCAAKIVLLEVRSFRHGGQAGFDFLISFGQVANYADQVEW